MARDFDIIIGGNTGLLESDIKSALDNIGTQYPVKLKAYIENEDEISAQIGKISEKLRALGNFTVPTGKGSALGSLEDDIGSASTEAKKLASNLDKAFENVQSEAKKATKEAENLLKVTQKIDAESNKVTKTSSVTGNDFFAEKTTFTLGDDNKFTPESVEKNFDFKKLRKYVQEIKSDLDLWGNSVDVTGDKVKILNTILSNIDEVYRLDPQGAFVTDINNVKRMHDELTQASEIIKNQQKEAKKLEEQFKKANLSMLSDKNVASITKDIENLKKSSNVYKEKTDLDSDDNFEKQLDYQQQKLKENIDLNKVLKSRQEEIDRMSKKIATNIEDWKNNGVLAKSEINALGKEFSKLDRNSENFEEQIVNISNKVNGLKTKETELIRQQKLEQEAVNKVAQEKVKWEEKINKLKSEGYYHNKQMQSLEGKLSTLNDGQKRDLEEVNKLLKDINNQYEKSVAFANKSKRKVEVDKDVSKQGKKVDKIDTELLSSDALKDYKKIQKEIGKLSVDQNDKEYQETLSKINQLYDSLLVSQKEGIALKNQEIQQSKEQAKLQEYLKKKEEETVAEQNKQRQMLIEQQVKEAELKRKAKEDDDRVANQIADKKTTKTFDSVNKEAKKEAEAHNKELEKQQLNQMKINEEVKEFNRLKDQLKQSGMFDDSDFGKLNTLIDNLSKDSKTLEKDLKSVYKELDDIGKLHNKIGSEREKVQSHLGNMEKSQVEEQNKKINETLNERAKLAEEMGALNEKSVNNRDKRESEMDLAQLKAIEAEQKRQYDNQVKIHNVTQELNKELAQIAQRDLFKEEDIAKVNQMINGLTKDSINLEQQFKEIRKEINNTSKTLDNRGKDLNAVAKEIQNIENRTLSLDEKFRSMEYRAERGFNNYPKHLRKVKELYKEIAIEQEKLKAIDISTPLGRSGYEDQYKRINDMLVNANKETSKIRDNMTSHQNSLMGRITHAFKQVPIWMGAMGVFYGAVSSVQQGFQSILDIDKAMVGLAKVTNGTNAELEKFKSTASSIGEELGVLTADVINSTAEFQKLGYSLPQASALAENTLLYANVGDMRIEDATSYMVSSIKGFNIEVDKSGQSVQRVIDMFNAVSNNYAISAEGIGQALQRSSAVLTQAGNTIEQSVSLITSANTTIQDPMKVGNALKTISMRLRGVDEEGKEVVNLVPELEATFNRFGATIMENETTFKSTFDIMNDLKQNWSKLTDIEQANITELIGGKEQGSIVASMIANWGDALGSYETALNSAGSAQKEFEKYTQSFEYKINSLKIALEEFWVTLIDDQAVKMAIDTLTGLVHVLTKLVDLFGSIPSILLPTMVALTLFSKTIRGGIFDEKVMKESKENISVLFDKTEQGAKRAEKGVKGLTSAFMHMVTRMAMVLGITLAVSLAIEGLYKVFTKESRARKEKIEGLEDEISQYEQLKESMESVNMSEYLYLDDKKSQSGLDTTQYEKYLQLQRTISEEMPDFIKGYDSEGNAIIRTADEIRALINEKERLNAINQYDLAVVSIEEMDTKEIDRQIKATKTMMKQANFSEEEGDAYRFLKTWIELNKEDLETGGRDLDESVNKLFSDLDKIISDENHNKSFIMDDLMKVQINAQNTNDINNVLSQVDNMINGVGERTGRLSKEVDNSRQEAEKSLNDYSTKVSDLLSKLINENDIEVNSGEFLFINQLKEDMIDEMFKLESDVEAEAYALDIPNRVAEILEGAKSANVNINKLFDFTLDSKVIEKEFDKFTESISKGDKESEVLISTLQRLRDEALKTSQSMSSNPVNPVPQTNVISVLDDYYNSVSSLDSAYRTLSEGQQLSNSEVLNLLKSHPELNKSLTTQNGFLKLNKDAIKSVADELKNKSRVQLEEAKRSVQIAKEEAEGNMKAIFKNMEAIQMLNKMRRDEAIALAAQENLSRKNMSYGEAVARGTEMEREINQYYDYMDEMSNIENAINSLDSISLGNITANPNPKKEKEKKEKKQELQDAIYIADKFALTMDRLSSLISIQQAKQDRLTKSSSAYRKSVQEELKLTNQKKKAIEDEIKSVEKQIKTKNVEKTGLISLGQKDNKTARAKASELAQELDGLRGELNGLKSDYEAVSNEAFNLNWVMVESNQENFNLLRDGLTDDIAYMDYMKNMYDQNSTSYKKFASQKIDMLKETQKYFQQELDYYEKVKRNSKHLTESQKNDLNALIREARTNLYGASAEFLDELQEFKEIEIEFKFKAYTDGLDDFSDAIDEIESKLDMVDEKDWSGQIQAQEELASSFRGQVEYINEVIAGLGKLRQEYGSNHELSKMIDDEIKSWKKELKSTQKDLDSAIKNIKKTYEKIADETVEIYKAGLQAQLDAENDAYDDMSKLHDRNHEKKMKQYQKELDMLSKIYDQQIEMINREDATRTYDNTLDKLRKEANDLQKQIDILSLDDSHSSITKRKELSDELKVKNSEITELQYQREKDLRIESLEDAKDVETEKLEDKTEILEEEHKNFMDNLEKEHKAKVRHLENMLKDERYFAQLRSSVMEGSLNEIAQLMENWQTTVGGHISTLGDTVVNNFTDKIRKAVSEFEKMNKLATGTTNKVTTADKALGNAQSGVNQNGNTGGLGSASGGTSSSGSSGGSTGGNAGSSSGSSSDFNKKYPYTKFSTSKVVKVTASVGLYKTAEKKNSEKIRDLDAGSEWKAYGEQNGMYDLGGGFSAKGNLKVVSASSSGSSSGGSSSGTRYHTVKSGETLSDLAQQYYGSSAQWNKIKNANPSVNPNKMQIGAKLLIPFRSGGYTGDWSGDEGRVALLHKKEQVLNEEQTLHLFNTIDKLENLKRMKVNSNININKEEAQPIQQITNEYNLTLEIENMNGDKKVVDIVSDQIMQNIKRTKGGRFD